MATRIVRVERGTASFVTLVLLGEIGSNPQMNAEGEVTTYSRVVWGIAVELHPPLRVFGSSNVQ